jgi:hypothetical protein
MRDSIMASTRASLVRRGRGFALALALLAWAGSAAADTAAAAAPAAAPAAGNPEAAPSAATTPDAGDGNELVCKRVRETGSNISKRVCRTRDQLATDSEAARGMLEQRNRMTNSAGSDEGG